MKFLTTSRISENIHETPEGYLVCVGVSIARIGEMIYAKGESPVEVGEDGIAHVTRDAEEIFRPETMASFEGKAVTLGHPSVFVNPENHASLAKGAVQNVRRGTGDQEGDLIADLLITDSRAISLVKTGLREVSCGYECDYVLTGVAQGVQKNIIGNHLALVEEGRAGSSYAINDHKGKGLKMKLGEKIRAIFAKAQDEAMKVADAASCDESPPKKENEKKAEDAGGGYEGLMKDLGALVSKYGPKDAAAASTQPSPGVPAEVKAVDAPKEEPKKEEKQADAAPSMEERMKKMEDAIAGLSAAKVGDKDAEEGEEEAEDASESAGEEKEAEDDDFQESMMVGDSAARLEILAPGMSAEGKGVKGKALLAAYATTDGKAVIDTLTGGKAPDVKDEAKVETLFVAASELLKARRTAALAGTRTLDFASSVGTRKGAMTADRMNEVNAKHYAARH